MAGVEAHDVAEAILNGRVAAAVAADGLGEREVRDAVETACPESFELAIAELESQRVEPDADLFELELIELEKRCFGSAGCNVTFRLELAYGGILDFDPDKTYELRYEIQGGEDPMLGTIDIQGDQYSQRREEYRMGTPDADAILEAQVLEIRER